MQEPEDELAQWQAVKAAETLLINWRAPAFGVYRHQGVMPSYRKYNGFWSWDSWKHAAALATFHPELGRDQVRAMFDYQAAHRGRPYDGMLPDLVSLNPGWFWSGFRDEAYLPPRPPKFCQNLCFLWPKSKCCQNS